MKDKNGIEIECKNCEAFEYCKDSSAYEQCQNRAFSPGKEAYEARIAELQELVSTLKQKLTKKEQERRHESSLLNKRIAALQKELNIVQESERAEAQEADKLRAEVKELKAHNEVLQRRVQEFSMELLDRTMRDNKDVLVRLKQAEIKDAAEEAWNKRQEQFSLSDMELLRDIVEAKLKSVKRDDEYRCSLLRLSIKCMDIIKDLKEGEY